MVEPHTLARIHLKTNKSKNILVLGKVHLAGPAAAIFGPVKEWPSQNFKKIGWAKFLAGPLLAGSLKKK